MKQWNFTSFAEKHALVGPVFELVPGVLDSLPNVAQVAKVGVLNLVCLLLVGFRL